MRSVPFWRVRVSRSNGAVTHMRCTRNVCKHATLHRACVGRSNRMCVYECCASLPFNWVEFNRVFCAECMPHGRPLVSTSIAVLGCGAWDLGQAPALRKSDFVLVRCSSVRPTICWLFVAEKPTMRSGFLCARVSLLKCS